MVVYHKADSAKRTMIQDHYKKVEMSTFLKDNTIMIQVDYRYLIFNADGTFIEEVTFEDINKDRKDY